MATDSSILAWRIPWTGEPGWPLSMGSHRVGDDWSNLAAAAAMVKNPSATAGDIRDVSSIPGSGRSPGGGHGNPLQYSCLGNPMDGGSWQTTVHGVAKSRTQLKKQHSTAQQSRKTVLCSHKTQESPSARLWLLKLWHFPFRELKRCRAENDVCLVGSLWEHHALTYEESHKKKGLGHWEKQQPATPPPILVEKKPDL